jgi:hypothetical protein
MNTDRHRFNSQQPTINLHHEEREGHEELHQPCDFLRILRELRG